MNPSEIRFRAKEAKSCAGCVFLKEAFRGCVHAADVAVRRGMPDCDDKAPSGKSYIYVMDESDPRQLPLLEVSAEMGV